MDVYIRENAGIYWLRKLDSAIKKAFTYVEANQVDSSDENLGAMNNASFRKSQRTRWV